MGSGYQGSYPAVGCTGARVVGHIGQHGRGAGQGGRRR